MPLEGLRAWIGEVERKLGMRTRIFLVLSVIALGGAGAAIYLAVDAREDSVSESDVQALQERLEAQIAEGAATAPTVPEEPVEPEPAPEPQPKPESGSDEGAGGSGSSTGGASGGGASAAADGGGKANAQDLLEQAEKQNAPSEAESTGK
jgi:outer membrane biosynthesis protein TonB